MSYLCIKKQEPTAGSKGIMCGGVFLPIESYESEHPTPASQIPSEGLVLYVPLSETPNASEWAEYGSITYKTVDGVPCAYFNGDNSNGLYSDKEFEMPAFTVSIVFNTKSFSPTSGYMPYLVNFGPSSTNDNDRLALRFDNYYAGNKNALAMVYYGVYLLVQNLSTDIWYSAQMKFDGNQISLYLNGELQSQLNVSLKTIQSGVWIGKSPSKDGAFNGYLSSLRVYNRALSDDEIALLAREFVFNSAPLAGRKGLLVPVGESVAAPPESGLVFYAPLSEESSTAETGQALTKTGTVTYQTVEGLPCARFDTTYSYLSATVPNMAGVLTGTISLWIYISGDAGGNASTYPTFFTFGDKSKPYGGFILGTWATREGEIKYETNSTGNEWPSASNPLTKGRWINFVATITESGTLQSYVNGKEGGVGETGAITINEPSVYINYADLSCGVDGIYIADVRIYNRILSASEIQSLALEHNPTKSLFIPLQTASGTPQAGQKGIIVRSTAEGVGNLFIAVKGTEVADIPQDGLIFHAPFNGNTTPNVGAMVLVGNEGDIAYNTQDGITYAVLPGTFGWRIYAQGTTDLTVGNEYSYICYYRDDSDHSKPRRFLMNMNLGSNYQNTYVPNSVNELNVCDRTIDSSSGKWHFICIRSNGSVASIKGFLDTSTWTSGAPGNYPYRTDSFLAAPSDWATSSQGQFWHGGIFDFAVYNRILTDEEVENLYQRIFWLQA